MSAIVPTPAAPLVEKPTRQPKKVTAKQKAQVVTRLREVLAQHVYMPDSEADLQPDDAQEILKLLEQGIPRELVLTSVGVTDAQWDRWEARAKDGDPDYRDFFKLAAMATAKGQIKMFQAAQTAADGKSWNGFAWMLERAAPQVFEKKVQETKTVEERKMVAELPAQLSNDDWEKRWAK